MTVNSNKFQNSLCCNYTFVWLMLDDIFRFTIENKKVNKKKKTEKIK